MDTPRMMRLCAAAAGALLLCAAAPGPTRTEKTEVAFQINDSLIKDKVLPGAAVSVAKAAGGPPVARGRSDGSGRLRLSLPPGRYAASYTKPGYVPIERSPFQVGRAPRLITTTMSMLLEAVGQSERRRVQIVLNWGSRQEQVKDADSHLLCPCGGAHVYFRAKEHKEDDHSAALDVDDMDWGGPETITLLDPPPGDYRYWVDRYSDSGTLADSEVVVRVVFDDRSVGEFPIPPDAKSQTWRPFKSVSVGQDRVPLIVPFDAAELARGADRELPAEQSSHDGPGGGTILAVLAACFFIAIAAIRVFKLLRLR